MDIGTIIGLLGAIGLIVAAMVMGGSPESFVDAPSLMMVFGGTVSLAAVNQKLKVVLGAGKVVMQTFFDKGTPPEALIPVLVDLAQKARKEGLVSLEGEDIADPFIARGLRLGVDGLSPELVKAALNSEVAALKTRHQTGYKVFRFMGGTAPSMGMIGTLVGLVQMLKTLDDPSAIGPAMAVALLTTLYGAILAFVVFNPLADKLENRSEEEIATKRMAVAGIESILQGDNSMVIQSKLEAFLSPVARAALAKDK